MVESDGSMVRTGELERAREGGESWGPAQGEKEDPMAGGAAEPGGGAGEQMFALSLRCGYGENTWVHGVGDGAPWMAQQVAAVFPRQRFLLDRYHLLEHLHHGASALAPDDAESARAWVAERSRRIDGGGVAGVVAECRSLGGGGAGHPLDQLAGYLDHEP